MTVILGEIQNTNKNAYLLNYGVSKQYVDQNKLDLAGGTITGDLYINGNLTLTNTVYDDLQMPLTTGKQGNLSKPDFDYDNVGYLFPSNNTDEKIYLIGQLSHKYKEGTDLQLHIHWSQSNSNNIKWFADYKFINVGDPVPDVWTTISGSTPSQPYTGGTLHQLTSLGTINGEGKKISSILLIKIYRNDNYSGDVLAYQVDAHFQIDTIGSDDEYLK